MGLVKRCESCGASEAPRLSPTGRRLCDDCFADLAMRAAAGAGIADGDAERAVGAGLAAGWFAKDPAQRRRWLWRGRREDS